MFENYVNNGEKGTQERLEVLRNKIGLLIIYATVGSIPWGGTQSNKDPANGLVVCLHDWML